MCWRSHRREEQSTVLLHASILITGPYSKAHQRASWERRQQLHFQAFVKHRCPNTKHSSKLIKQHPWHNPHNIHISQTVTTVPGTQPSGGTSQQVSLTLLAHSTPSVAGLSFGMIPVGHAGWHSVSVCNISLLLWLIYRGLVPAAHSGSGREAVACFIYPSSDSQSNATTPMGCMTH